MMFDVHECKLGWRIKRRRWWVCSLLLNSRRKLH